MSNCWNVCVVYRGVPKWREFWAGQNSRLLFSSTERNIISNKGTCQESYFYYIYNYLNEIFESKNVQIAQKIKGAAFYKTRGVKTLKCRQILTVTNWSVLIVLISKIMKSHMPTNYIKKVQRCRRGYLPKKIKSAAVDPDIKRD